MVHKEMVCQSKILLFHIKFHNWSEINIQITRKMQKWIDWFSRLNYNNMSSRYSSSLCKHLWGWGAECLSCAKCFLDDASATDLDKSSIGVSIQRKKSLLERYLSRMAWNCLINDLSQVLWYKTSICVMNLLNVSLWGIK